MSDTNHHKATEIIGTVIDLTRKDAINAIHRLCGDDKVLLDTVLSLYEDIMDELPKTEPSVKEKPTTKNKKSKVSRLNIKNNTQSTFSINSSKIGRLSRLIFDSKQYRLILILFFLLILLLGGFLARSYVRDLILQSEQEEKEALLKANVEILERWITSQKKVMATMATNPEIISTVGALDSLYNNGFSIADLKYSDESKAGTRALEQLKHTNDFIIYSVVSPREPKEILSTSLIDSAGVSRLIDETLGSYIYKNIIRAQNGESVFIPPSYDIDLLHNYQLNVKPTVWCNFLSPIKNANNDIIGILVGSSLAKNEFSSLFQISQHGKTSETYAFDKEGRMISASRFTTELRQTVLLNYDSTAQTLYNITLLNPEVNVLDGKEIQKKETELEYTKIIDLAFDNLAAEDSIYSGNIMEPYKDYRGINVIGAYHWFPKYEFGIITEEDSSEALASLKVFRIVFIIFYLIIIALSYLLYHSNVKISRIGKKVDKLKQLGQYHLQSMIGEGGFGEVYKAEHSLLKTPVAIKLLKTEFIGTDMLDRFQKEVKVTASLANPNTIRVFDYGTSESGQFYYVMEYLNGISLDKVVDHSKEMPVGRVIFVLLQTCYSLLEAHSKGLVHRDIKPMNIMVCNQGGMYDTIKVLDFGLVKNIDTSKSQQTQLNRIGGTPMFMAPERLRDPFNADHRVDIYALGAVGVYMLSGQFLLELISQKMLKGQATLDGNLNQELIERADVPEELKNLLQNCISFSVEKRPGSVEDIIKILEKLKEEYPWAREDAKQWWKSYDVYSV